MTISNCDRILVIAPHPDDESIGCGGLLAKYGPQCDVLVLSDGRKGYRSSEPLDEDELARLRETELRKAMAIAKVHNVQFLRIPDGSVGAYRERIFSFDITPYTYIFVPNRMERHVDHCVVADILLKMKKRQQAKGALYEYEVWSPIASPTDVIDISNVIDVKLEMLAQHASQTRYVDYCAMAKALSRYRGTGFQVVYAEVFAFVPYRTFLQQVFDQLPGRIRRLIRKLRHAS